MDDIDWDEFGYDYSDEWYSEDDDLDGEDSLDDDLDDEDSLDDDLDDEDSLDDDLDDENQDSEESGYEGDEEGYWDENDNFVYFDNGRVLQESQWKRNPDLSLSL